MPLISLSGIVELMEDEGSAAAPGSIVAEYRRLLDGGWLEDAAQESAVAALAQLLTDVKQAGNKAPRGLYLFGPVGRGKSKLLSMFTQHAGAVRVRRTHMHTFMQEVHQHLHAIKKGDPIDQIARQIAAECKVLGFDEFYVTNIADGILLGRLFEHLFRYGVVVVSTSNWPMEELYQNGHNRKGFLPFIGLLRQNMREIDLGDGQDYRRTDDDAGWPLYSITIDADSREHWLRTQFEHYDTGGSSTAPGVIHAKATGGRVAWYRFADICEQPFGRKEYFELVEQLDTLIVEGVPAFGKDDSNAALRFVTLIDICYDLHRRVVISAADYPDELYVEGPVRVAFRRAASRIAEMQTWGADGTDTGEQP